MIKKILGILLAVMVVFIPLKTSFAAGNNITFEGPGPDGLLFLEFQLDQAPRITELTVQDLINLGVKAFDDDEGCLTDKIEIVDQSIDTDIESRFEFTHSVTIEVENSKGEVASTNFPVIVKENNSTLDPGSLQDKIACQSDQTGNDEDEDQGTNDPGDGESNDSINKNDVNVNIKKGGIKLTVEDKVLNINAELSNDATIKFDAETLDYKVVDSRGAKGSLGVQYTLNDFAHEDSQAKLVPAGNTVLNTPVQLQTVDSTQTQIVNGTINLDLTFDNSDFVKNGNYSSILITEVVISAQP